MATKTVSRKKRNARNRGKKWIGKILIEKSTGNTFEVKGFTIKGNSSGGFGPYFDLTEITNKPSYHSYRGRISLGQLKTNFTDSPAAKILFEKKKPDVIAIDIETGGLNSYNKQYSLYNLARKILGNNV